jgi:hypothetical protein
VDKLVSTFCARMSSTMAASAASVCSTPT